MAVTAGNSRLEIPAMDFHSAPEISRDGNLLVCESPYAVVRQKSCAEMDDLSIVDA
jgi:hypothetical protein